MSGFVPAVSCLMSSAVGIEGRRGARGRSGRRSTRDLKPKPVGDSALLQPSTVIGVSPFVRSQSLFSLIDMAGNAKFFRF
jgi:hypothetical protein